MKRVSIALAAAFLVALVIWGLWRAGHAGADGGGIIGSIFSSEPAEFARLDHLRAEATHLAKDSDADNERRTQAGRDYSEEMAKLPPEQRAAYFERLQTDEDRESALGALASMSDVEMTDMLDSMIDTMLKEDARLKPPTAAELQSALVQPAQPPVAGAAGELDATKSALADRSPAQRAMSDEMQRRLLKRMKERGIPIPPDFHIEF